MDIGVVEKDGPVKRNGNAPVKQSALEGYGVERAGDDGAALGTNSQTGNTGGGDSAAGNAQVLPADVIAMGTGADPATTVVVMTTQLSPRNGTREDDPSPILTSSSLGGSQFEEDTHPEGSVTDNSPVGGGSIDENSSLTEDTAMFSTTAPLTRAGRASPLAGSSHPSTDASDNSGETDQEWNLKHSYESSSEGLSAGVIDQFDGAGSNIDDDLPAQLNRLWGTPSPNRVKGLAVMQEMLRNRQELDGILSSFASTEGAAADALGSGSLVSNLRPFPLAMLAERFAPAIVEPSELRERSLTRVRIVTAAGLRVGLAKRVFAGEPLLPSDVEAEEEEHSRRPEPSPAPVESENLRSLVVPVPSAATAPETSPEEPIRYPSMGDVSSAMWCEEDEDEDAYNDRSQGKDGTAKTRRRLRFSVQMLDGHVFDDEDEDSETDDGGSGTDVEASTDEYGDSDGFGPARTETWPEKTSRKGGGVAATTSRGREAERERARESGGEEEGDGLGYRRKEELASVLRRLRAAIRRTDGVLPEEKVSALAKHVVRVAVLTASSSELVTATAARGAMRGLGDRIRLDTRGQRNGAFRRVTVFVGVRRWGRHHFGPGFAVETQDKYRLGWLRLSQATGVTGEGTSGDTPAAQSRRIRRGWRKRRGFLGLGRRTEINRQEEEDNVNVEGWVGTLTCNFCEGHVLSFRGASQDGNKKPGDSEPDPEILQEDGEEIFSEARDTERDDTTTESFETHNTSASADTARDSTAVRPVRADKRFTTSHTSSFGDGGGSWGERHRGAVRAGLDEEEWCTGHVCLRLRPVGLKESTARGREDEEEDAEHYEENSSCTSGAESEDHREHEDLDGNMHDGAYGVSDPVRPRPGGAKRQGVPLSSVTKGFAAGKKRPAVPCGVSSEQSSKSLEAFAWGDNAAGCLGLPLETSAALLPRVLEPWGLLPGERVVAVACSERHSLLVTSMGSVYSSGDGSDGALGFGGREGSEAFRLIEWFAEQMPPPKLCQASAGSDLIGCHSAALDADGRLYTWGVGAAAGHASLKPILLPREVETLGGFGTGSGARGADGRPAGLQYRVKGVACGGGFTVAVTRGGKVFSWGSWARGRLGLGRPPERTARGKKKVPRFQATPRMVSGLGDSPIVQVAAGAWHGMALTQDGEVFTWGHNASGQLGFLVTPSSRDETRKPFESLPLPGTTTTAAAASAMVNLSEMLRASWKPIKLPTFGDCAASRAANARAPVAGGGLGSGASSASGCGGGVNGRRTEQRRAVHIACGPEHSIVIDSRGAAWTWGAEGRACLGHGEAGYGAPGGGASVMAEAQARAMGLPGNENNKEQQPQTFVPLSREREVSRTRARRALAGGWAVPRMIMSLSASPDAAGLPAEGGLYRTRSRGGEIIVAAAAGFSHTAFITDEGKLCLFGEGAAVAGGDLARLEATAGEGGGGGGVGLGLREGGGLVRRSEQQEGPDPLTALSAVAGPTPVPREACATWFPAVASRRVAAVVCGGQHIIALLAGDHIGYTLGINFFRAAMGTERHLLGGDKATSSNETGHTARSRETSAGVDENDDDHQAMSGAGAWAKAGVDCELLVAGSYLHAHRVVLASRSPVLRDMIAQEERPVADGEGGAPLQLLLPDLRFDVARALLEFLYTGDLRRSLDLDSPLPYDLRAAAKSYSVPRLEALCTEAISLGVDPESGAEGWGQAVLPPTLAADLGGALGSMEHADVKFLAGGRPVYAHRAVLSSESDYFAAMFRFRDQMADGTLADGQGGDTVAEIIVPDSYTGFVRLLLFLYTGVLPDSNPESVLEDLVAADRYRLLGMKRLCQSMLRISADNCLQALRTAEMVTAPLLRESALFFVEHNLSKVSQQEGFHETMSRTPGLAEAILSRLHATATNASTVSSAAARQRRLHDRKRQHSRAGSTDTWDDATDDGDLSFRPDSPFPWGAAFVAVICGAVYYRLSNVVAVGMLVPIVNGVFFVCLAVFAFHKLKAKGATDNDVRRKRSRRVPRKGSARREGGGDGRRRGGQSTYLFG